MVIVKDIQDAITMRKALSSIQSRAHTFAKSRDSILLEIGQLIMDLDANVEREEIKMWEEANR